MECRALCIAVNWVSRPVFWLCRRVDAVACQLIAQGAQHKSAGTGQAWYSGVRPTLRKRKLDSRGSPVPTQVAHTTSAAARRSFSNACKQERGLINCQREGAVILAHADNTHRIFSPRYGVPLHMPLVRRLNPSPSKRNEQDGSCTCHQLWRRASPKVVNRSLSMVVFIKISRPEEYITCIVRVLQACRRAALPAHISNSFGARMACHKQYGTGMAGSPAACGAAGPRHQRDSSISPKAETHQLQNCESGGRGMARSPAAGGEAGPRRRRIARPAPPAEAAVCAGPRAPAAPGAAPRSTTARVQWPMHTFSRRLPQNLLHIHISRSLSDCEFCAICCISSLREQHEIHAGAGHRQLHTAACPVPLRACRVLCTW